jgi:TRAP-type C4-dicarboxylate transport system permease small subunit
VLKKLFDHLEEVLGACIIFGMALLTFINVITRYAITYSLAFTEELTISMFVWITLLGASIAFRKNAHLAVTVCYDMVSPRWKKIFFFIANACCLIFFFLLLRLGTSQVMDEWELSATSDGLGIPTCIYSAGMPVFSVLIIVRILQAMRQTIRDNSY